MTLPRTTLRAPGQCPPRVFRTCGANRSVAWRGRSGHLVRALRDVVEHAGKLSATVFFIEVRIQIPDRLVETLVDEGDKPGPEGSDGARSASPGHLSVDADIEPCGVAGD